MSDIAVEVKQEPGEDDIQKRILTLLKEHPKGLKETEICCYFQDSTAEIVRNVNILTQQNRISFHLNKDGGVLLKLAVPSVTSQVLDIDENEQLVLQLIEEVGNKGIWRHEIHRKSKIVEVQLNKILKNLTTKKLIKPITSVLAGKKKMYILANLEPNESVTGGNFYSGQQFDSEYFKMLHAMCYKFLEDKAEEVRKLPLNPVEQRMRTFLSTSDVHEAIQNSKVSKVELKPQEIDDILLTLVFDGKAEHVVRTTAQGGHTNYYCAVAPLIETSGLMRTPCGQCPLLNDCKEGGIISPSTCEYMKNWLTF